MIKMIATDIDGTILKWGLDFSPKMKACIKKLKNAGVKVVLVTGRMHCATVPVAKELGLETPIISYQGGLIKDVNNNTLYQKNLDSNYAKEIISWARKNNIHINLYLDDKLYVENDNDIVRNYTDGKFIDYTVCSFDDLEIKNVNKILAIDLNDPDRVTGWVNELREKYPQLYIVKSTPYFCEVGCSEAKKSLGVEFLCKMWNLKQEEVLTIGDQNNDIDLVQAGGIGVAMGNGTPELKECADYITDTVDNDGFVKAVEKFVISEAVS
ncbi:MAG: HAD family hydrolase [Muribaculaceae bacterium]|nr:HAD family hydrolase [Muribaculaceae bacterium]